MFSVSFFITFHWFRWNNKTSLVTPEEEVFYLVAFLSSAVPSSIGTDGLEHILAQNQRILDYCIEYLPGVKQYLPHYSSQEEWRAHFGPKWQTVLKRKSKYDPSAILAPGQRIFQKGISFLWQFYLNKQLITSSLKNCKLMRNHIMLLGISSIIRKIEQTNTQI